MQVILSGSALGDEGAKSKDPVAVRRRYLIPFTLSLPCDE